MLYHAEFFIGLSSGLSWLVDAGMVINAIERLIVDKNLTLPALNA